MKNEFRVIIDARLINHAGLGRYSTNLIRALCQHPCSVKLKVLGLKDSRQELSFCKRSISGNVSLADRYTIKELFDLHSQVTDIKYDIFHSANYVLPPLAQLPSVVTIHDVMRLTLPEYCHSNAEFIRRFGLKKFINIFFIAVIFAKELSSYRQIFCDFVSKPLTDTDSRRDHLYHSNEVFKIHHLYIYLMTKLSLKNADAVITSSNFSKNEILSIFGVNHGKLHVIYPGVDSAFCHILDIQEIEMLKAKYNIPSSYYLHVGLKRQHKNISVLIKAYNNLIYREKDVPSLVFVGPRDEDMNLLVKKTRFLGLTQKIHFLDVVPDNELNLLYNGATAVIVPSLYEGFGFPVVEAMTCNTPVAVSSIPVFKEIAKDYALFIDPLDVSAWEIALLRLASKKIRGSFTFDAMKYSQKFNWDSVANQVINLYEKLMNTQL